MEAVSTLVKDDADQTVLVAALVAALVTSSHAPVPVSGLVLPLLFRCPERPNLQSTLV